MSSYKPPAYRHYAKDFLAGTADMSCAEVGAYIRLLDHAWDGNPTLGEKGSEDLLRILGRAQKGEGLMTELTHEEWSALYRYWWTERQWILWEAVRDESGISGSDYQHELLAVKRMNEIEKIIGGDAADTAVTVASKECERLWGNPVAARLERSAL